MADTPRTHTDEAMAELAEWCEQRAQCGPSGYEWYGLQAAATHARELSDHRPCQCSHAATAND